MNQGFMGIVACEAGQLPTRPAPAAALLKPKRLKSNCCNALDTHLYYVAGGAVARSTKID